jgi:hypothetical protein
MPIYLKSLLNLSKLILKIAGAIKAHIQCNLEVPHQTLVTLGISAAITLVVFGIFYMSGTEIMRLGNAEALTKLKPNDECC